MKKRKELGEISNRTNINHKRTQLNEVIIYEDHRTILNVLFLLKKKSNEFSPVDIIMFDKHDDFKNLKSSTLDRVKKFLDDPSEIKLNQLVEFEISFLDDDWVKCGMELGLINNVFLFNAKDTHVRNFEEYETNSFGNKFLYNIGDVWDSISDRGALGDIANQDYDRLRRSLNWKKLESGKLGFGGKMNPFVFDIDLDCFSTEVLDRTISIPRKILYEKLSSKEDLKNVEYSSTIDFVRDLITKSEVVTICLESNFCGGIREAQKIFNSIDDLLFDGELGR